MYGASRYIDLISGRRRGVGAAAARAALAALEPIYAAAVNYRNRRYDRAQADIHRLNVPVISVGNLTLGGTGKTPMVKWLARWFCDRQLRVVLVSRGYGAKQGTKNDEALELANSLPDVPHLQNPDRVAAAHQAVADHATQVILLDDGFQHRRLARDLDIVLLDALEPFGFEHVFPRGALREPISSLRRANIVCLTRADQVDATRRDEIRARVHDVAPQAIWCEAAHRPQHLIDAADNRKPIESLRGLRVAAFCGIGNPAAFRKTLVEAGCEVVAWREFPDHYAFTAHDVENLSNWIKSLSQNRRGLAHFAESSEKNVPVPLFADGSGIGSKEQSVAAVLCTHKDFVKLHVDKIGDILLHAVVVEMDFLSGQTELESAIARTITSANEHRTISAA